MSRNSNYRSSSLYHIFKLISYTIRAFVLPNPFIPFIKVLSAKFNYTGDIIGLAIAFNFLLGNFILHYTTYGVVGTAYRKSENPILGSVLYFIIFWLNSMALIGLGMLSSLFNLWIMFIGFIITLLIESYILLKLRERIMI
ncbi:MULTISPECIES: hypothetical protein [unclassified Sedimentibacter]|uniref:hypothetical protein n=1 Tax=unclassified Sedimentibacter TaxID=2649220 RepID=UPI0027DF8A6D|nr:hypothetical protein [Sedimentibacter sp. MB35-C1]WMJ77317.1 hypothetical protein RBQ61_17395 [Sedimentibacter sp. MB35-C1]